MKAPSFFMDEMQTEIGDDVGSSPENKTGVVGTTAITLNRTDGKPCTSLRIGNPYGGSRGNTINKVIYVTVDGSDPLTKGETIGVGESLSFTCSMPSNNIKIAASAANTNYEAVLTG